MRTLVTPAKALTLALLILLAPIIVHAQSIPDFGQLEERLHIRPEQKEQYDRAVGATKLAMLAVGLAAIEMKNAFAAELAKDRPDFRALARKQNELIEQQRPLFQEAGREWQKLYRLMDPDQVQAARAYLNDNLGRLFQ